MPNKYIFPEQSQNFLVCKTWLLGENLVKLLTLGQIWKSLLLFLSYQFDAFFSYFYTLKHKSFHRIQKHWWHLQAGHAFINRKCMKNGIFGNNNQWCNVVYRVLDQRRLFWHTKEKFRNTKRSWVFLIFLKSVKKASVGLKLDRPQLQHWLLFLEHNWPPRKSDNSTFVDLPVPMGYDCVCASACASSSPDFERCRLQFEF